MGTFEAKSVPSMLPREVFKMRRMSCIRAATMRAPRSLGKRFSRAARGDFPRDTTRAVPMLLRMKHPLFSFALAAALGVVTFASASAVEKEVAVFKTAQGEMVVEFWPEVAPKTV